MFDINSPLMKIAISCKISGNFEEGKQFLSIAAKYADDLKTLDEIGYLQSELKDYGGSVETLKKCQGYTIDAEQSYALRSNLAKMYNHLNNPDASIGYSLANLAVSGDNINYETLMELSFSHYLKGDYEISEKMMRDLATDEKTPEKIRERALYNIGTFDLERGDFKRGLSKGLEIEGGLSGFIDIGHKCGIWINKEIEGVPLWNGLIDTSKTIIIHGEGGIGDEIINVRFMNNIKQRGMRAIWITGHKHLKEVFNRNGYETIGDISELPIDIKDNCFQLMGMYLPIVLDLDKHEVWNGPYLKPSQEYIEKWMKILPEGKKLCIKQSGSKFYDQDLHRSLPLSFIENIRWSGEKINLQIESEYDLKNVFNCAGKIQNIEDTLAIIWLSDQMVSSCTSVVHMAGAMGKNCIVCPPIACYYVWLGDAKWYDDNMTVIRQKKHKDWNHVLERVNEYLK